MSYSIVITTKDIDHNDIEVGSWDCTCNLAPMWRKAGCDLRAFNGKRAGDVAPILREALVTMKANPQDYIPLNPANGWGSYEELLPALERLLHILTHYPSAVVSVEW